VLEDVLGLSAALVVSRVNNSGRYVPAEGSDGEWAYVEAAKFGTGRPVALLLLIPLVATALILGTLIIMVAKGEEDAAGYGRYRKNEGDENGRPLTESLLGMMWLGGVACQRDFTLNKTKSSLLTDDGENTESYSFVSIN
jgi:hypothetical protein